MDREKTIWSFRAVGRMLASMKHLALCLVFMCVYPAASRGQAASQGDFLSMQGIAKQVQDFMRVAKVTETTVMVPGKPAADGGYQMMIISSKPLVTPADDSTPAARDPRKGWMIFATSAAAVFTKESSQPITSIAFADSETLKERVYYVLDMATARDIQQRLKSDAINNNTAYSQIRAALRKVTISGSP